MGLAMNAADIAKACHEAHREFHATIAGGAMRHAWEELTDEQREELEHQVEARLRTPGYGVTLNANPRDLIYFAVIHTLRDQLDGEAFTVSPLMMPQTV